MEIGRRGKERNALVENGETGKVSKCRNFNGHVPMHLYPRLTAGLTGWD